MATLFEVLNTKYTALIGSSPENDIVFNDPNTSPRHCQISKIEEGKYLIVDLNSATGTFVNNQKIDKEFISDTDFISVGNNIFQIKKKLASSTSAPVQQEVEVGEMQNNKSIGVDTSNAAKQATEPTSSTGFAAFSSNGTVKEQKGKIIVYFLSAPEDESTCMAINKHLSTIRFSSSLPIEINGDFKIPAGEDIARFKQKLYEADIVLAFISVDFLNNDECYERIKKVIANHNNHKTILLPILARNCMWKATPFANLPLLPKNQQPLNNKQFWNSEDDALTAVVNDIYTSINDFTKHSTEEKPIQHSFTIPTLQIDWRKNYLWNAFWKRFAASMLDALIIGVPLLLLANSLIQDAVSSDVNYYYNGTVSESTAAQALGYYLLVVILQILVYAFMESSNWRATPGKLIMKLQITDEAGNPISFMKSVKRNVVKLLISAFSGIGNGILIIIYAIAQIISYAKTKKFFHDQLTNTVIGEKVTK